MCGVESWPSWQQWSKTCKRALIRNHDNPSLLLQGTQALVFRWRPKRFQIDQSTRSFLQLFAEILVQHIVCVKYCNVLHGCLSQRTNAESWLALSAGCFVVQITQEKTKSHNNLGVHVLWIVNRSVIIERYGCMVIYVFFHFGELWWWLC